MFWLVTFGGEAAKQTKPPRVLKPRRFVATARLAFWPVTFMAQFRASVPQDTCVYYRLSQRSGKVIAKFLTLLENVKMQEAGILASNFFQESQR